MVQGLSRFDMGKALVGAFGVKASQGGHPPTSFDPGELGREGRINNFQPGVETGFIAIAACVYQKFQEGFRMPFATHEQNATGESAVPVQDIAVHGKGERGTVLLFPQKGGMAAFAPQWASRYGKA